MAIYLLLFISIFLSGCSKEIDPGLQGPLSKNHKIIVKKLLNTATKCNRGGNGTFNCTSWLGKRKQPQNGSSWEGKWIVTATKSALTTNEGVQYIPLKLTNRNYLVKDSSLVIASNEPVRIEFLNLIPSYQSIAITDGQTQLIQLSDFKDNNSDLSWTSSVGDSYIMQSKASYNPSTDSLKGRTDILMSNQIAASYKWEASRVTDNVFNEYARQGIIQPNLPHGEFNLV